MENEKYKSRVLEKASHTALMATVYRFLATKDKRKQFRGPDNLAQVFLPPKAGFFLSFKFFRKFFIRKLHEKAPGTYEYVTARTKFFDELFVNSLKEDIPQIVLLGAGYDTRAFRFQEILGRTTIYEIDVPTTQNNKLKLLKRNRVTIPENLTYVPVNFNTDNVEQTLLKAGYDPTKKTLFIWEGVTMYISEEAINNTFSFVKNNSGMGSSIAFDYLYKSVILGKCSYYGARELAEVVKKKGEIFSFGIEEGKIDEFLLEKGFTHISHFTPNQFEEKYLYDDNRNFMGNIYGFACHVHAKLKY